MFESYKRVVFSLTEFGTVYDAMVRNAQKLDIDAKVDVEGTAPGLEKLVSLYKEFDSILTLYKSTIIKELGYVKKAGESLLEQDEASSKNF